MCSIAEVHMVFLGSLRSKSCGNLDAERKYRADFTGFLLSKLRGCLFGGLGKY